LDGASVEEAAARDITCDEVVEYLRRAENIHRARDCNRSGRDFLVIAEGECMGYATCRWIYSEGGIGGVDCLYGGAVTKRSADLRYCDRIACSKTSANIPNGS